MKTEQQPTLLLVINNIGVAQWYKHHLKNEPVELVHVDTGMATLAYLQQNTPQAILLDLKLPNMDGIEIIQYVKQKQLDCPIITITVESIIPDVTDETVDVSGYGTINFVKKPLAAEQLISTLHKILNAQDVSYPIEISKEYPPPLLPQGVPAIPAIPAIYRHLLTYAESL